MSSGSYFPPPVRAVAIPKAGGGVRILGVPTVADRIAQTAVAMVLEPVVETVFHPDSYGYRPGRSALDAVEACKQRCWRRPWVVDLDIQGFFDNVPHEQIIAAVEKHTDRAVGRAVCEAVAHRPDAAARWQLVRPRKGTPQGSAISPLLSNLFLHYAFDAWLDREFPAVRFERYCDDAVVHCASEKQAKYVRDAIAGRLRQFGLNAASGQDPDRVLQTGRARPGLPVSCFTFLGFTFQPRAARLREDG